jgi:hypothetical protein
MDREEITMKDTLSRAIIYLTVMMCMALNMLTTRTVYADTGPHSKVVVYFYGLPEEEIYVTLLSSTNSTGPYVFWDGKKDDTKKEPPSGQDMAWEQFYGYRDKDGFMFLQYAQAVREGQAFEWNYRPPEKFKVLVYLPEADRLMVSDDVLERYALHSVFKVDLSQEVDGKFVSKQEYRMSEEIAAFLIRLLITLSIEIALAWAFNYRKKIQLVIITLSNVFTQILLNLYVFSMGAQLRPLRFEESFGLRSYLLIELAVVAIEAVIYSLALEKRKNVDKAICYAIIANTVSFFAGIGLSRIIPFTF